MKTSLLLLLFVVAACGDSDKKDPAPAPDIGNDALDTADADGSEEEPDADPPDVTPDVPPDLPPGEPGEILGVPETQRWLLPTLTAPVQVVRTEGNVPHIYAENRHDLGVALGFTVARDRLFVMDLQRRLAQGKLSALLGDLALGADIESRQLGMPYVAQRIHDNMAPEDAEFVDAFVEGINRYIELTKEDKLQAPSEIALAALLLGYTKPADALVPFTRLDIAAMVVVIMYETTFDTGDPGRQDAWERLSAGLFDEDAAFSQLRTQGARDDVWERLDSFFPVASTDGFGIQDGRKPADPVVADVPRAVGGIQKALSERVRSRLDRLAIVLGRREADNFGSNCWAVHGDFAEDGFALVAGDGHLPLYVPSIMWQVGMDTKVFGGGDIRQAGVLIQSLPVLGVGTNGDIAWSQVNPVADTTDWYREELELGDDGLPARSRFADGWRDLVRVDEEIVIADAPALDSVGRTETFSRWTTFDGRYLFDVEGRVLAEEEAPGEGEAVVRFADRSIVPGDMDDDGVVTAVSFDYTAFDATRYISAVSEFAKAKTVADYQESTKGLVGNMLYSSVVDGNGDILFTPYQGVPCRGYLPRDEDGRWLPGADPTQLLDGTTYGGFSIPTGTDGKVDEAPGQEDPYKCIVPFDATPQSTSPAEGFVLNANNQPAPIHNDGTLYDDPWYIGGPWSSVRADSIRQGLEAATADRNASIEDMAAIQGDQRSRLGELFAPYVVQAVMDARALTLVDRELSPWEARLVAMYTADKDRLDAVTQRFSAWAESGYDARSGVDTFYNTSDEQGRADAVATMIFNAWLPRALEDTFGDENMNPAFRFSGSRRRAITLRRLLEGRGGDNPGALSSWNEATGESAFFDVLGTDEVERSHEVLLSSLSRSLDWLTAEPTARSEGGFGTADMDQWLWGLRHQVRFESVIADQLPPDSGFGFLLDAFSINTNVHNIVDGPLDPMDPRRRLDWFPRPGDNYSVDAASPGFSGTRFTYGSGPVMRMVIGVKDGEVRGQNVVPGGQSGLVNSEFFADQARLWLGNETLPLRYTPSEVAEGATGREVLAPQ